MRHLPALLLLIALASPHHAQAAIQLENRVQLDNVETRSLITRLEDVLALTESTLHV